jgi:hypothetical protein
LTFFAYTLYNIAHKKRLTNREQQLLHKIRQSITANPFSRQRAVADSRISDLAPNTKPEKLLNAAIEVALKSGHEFIHSNRADVSLFDGRAMSASLNRVSAVSCSPAVMNRIRTAANHINTITLSWRLTKELEHGTTYQVVLQPSIWKVRYLSAGGQKDRA